MISFDTMRRDHLGCYGYEKPLAPYLDRLADEGVVFEDCIANCGWTLPQHVTMVTGLHPIRHGVIYLKEMRQIPQNIGLLAEVFRKAGYVTLGFCNQNHYGGDWSYGFHRGMNSFTNAFPYNNMMENLYEHVNAYFEMLKDKPFFIYIHTNDTHEHFAASEPFGSKWGTEYHNRYEGEISYVDHYFGKILEKLDEEGLSETTLVVATSDHGSEFKEHGFMEKKLNLYDEIVRVPLLMRLPGVLPEGERVGGQVETMDIAPTIMKLCSLEQSSGLDGRQLVEQINDDDSGREYVFSHTLHETMYWYEHWSVRTPEFKMIRTCRLPKPDEEENLIEDRFQRLEKISHGEGKSMIELYDLASDPEESENIAKEQGDLVEDLNSRLKEWIKTCGYDPAGGLP